MEFDESNGFQGAHENLDDVGDEPLREAMKNILVGDIKALKNLLHLLNITRLFLAFSLQI